MESVFLFICEHSRDAYWMMFILLMLAGLNVPISEDILLIGGGALASSCIPEGKWHLYVWMFFGCWFSAWEAYWIGRILGPKLYEIRWFKNFVSEKKIQKLHHYYEKFGVLTFIVGRFIPGGVRNTLFMTAGMGKMPFLTFVLRDLVASLISSLVIFHIGYAFGKNNETLLLYYKKYQFMFFAMIFMAFAIWFVIYLYRRATNYSA
jgi:membrane protein DedA with SNARE-associated domain